MKNPPAKAGDGRDTGSVSGSERSPEEGNGNPLQYSSLGNPMNRGAWWAADNGLAKIRTQLSTHTHPTTTPRTEIFAVGELFEKEKANLQRKTSLYTEIIVNIGHYLSTFH